MLLYDRKKNTVIKAFIFSVLESSGKAISKNGIDEKIKSEINRATTKPLLRRRYFT